MSNSAGEQGQKELSNDKSTYVSLFVSYCWDDRQQHVRAMVKFLQTVERIKIIIDSDRLAVGEFAQADSVPKENIDAADVVVLFCNDNFKQSRHCRRVVKYAYKQKKPIIPVLLENEFTVDGWLLSTLTDNNNRPFALKNAVLFPPDKQFELVVNEFLHHLTLVQRSQQQNSKNATTTAPNKIIVDLSDNSDAEEQKEEVVHPQSKPSENNRVEKGECTLLAATPRLSNGTPVVRELNTVRTVKLFVTYPPTTKRLNEVQCVISFLKTNGFIVTPADDGPQNNAVENAYWNSDLVIAFCETGCDSVVAGFNLEQAMNQTKKFLLVDLDIAKASTAATATTQHRSTRSSSKFTLGQRPFSAIAGELLEKITHLMITRYNIPKFTFEYCKRNAEEELLKSSIKELCTSSNEVFLMVNGESGAGKTTLMAQFFNDKANNNFLAFECGVQYVAWLSVSKFCQNYFSPQQAIDEKHTIECLVEAFEFEHGAVIFPKNRFNLATLFGSKRNYGKLLIILDDFANIANNASVLEAIGKLGQFLRCIVISTRDSETMVSTGLVGNGGKILSQSSTTIFPMNKEEIEQMLSFCRLDLKAEQFELDVLSRECLGLPLIAKLIEGNFNALPGGTTGEAAHHYCEWLCQQLEQNQWLSKQLEQNQQQQLQQRAPAIREIVSRLVQLNFENSKEQAIKKEAHNGGADIKAFSVFLCVAPGEPVEVDDLAAIWNCHPNTAENLANAFAKKGLLCVHKAASGATIYSINDLIYKTVFDYASKTRNIFSTPAELISKVMAVPEVVYSAVKMHRENLLKKILSELDVRTLDKVSRFKYSENNNDEGNNGNKNHGGTFCEILFAERWIQYEGHRYERNVSAEILSILIETLATKGNGFVDVIDILSTTNEKTGNCLLLQIIEINTDGLQRESAKLKRKVNALLSSSDRKLYKESLIEKRRWLLEARDGRNSRLFAAAIRNDEILARQLLHASPTSINQANHRGETPLMAASANGSARIVEHLLEKGANVNARSHDNFTALHFAAKNGYDEVVDILLSVVPNGANVNAVDSLYGMTPLMFAARAGHRKVVDILLRHPSLDFDAKSVANSSTALMMAAQKGHVWIVEDITVVGGDPNTVNKDGVTPIMLAAENGHLETVKVLNSFLPSDLDVKRRDGMTALMLAAQRGYEPIVAYLRMNGASVTSTANGVFGRSALHFSAQNGHIRVVESLRMCGGADDANLRDNGPREATPLLLSAELDHGSVVQFLVTIGADVNARDKQTGFSALSLAARGGFWSIVEFLTVHGADVNAASPLTGETALHLAAQRGHEMCVEFLVKYGANINARCKAKKWTAFQYAAENGHASICRYLLDAGNSNITEIVPNSEIAGGFERLARLLCNSDNSETVKFASASDAAKVTRLMKGGLLSVPDANKNKRIKSGKHVRVA